MAGKALGVALLAAFAALALAQQAAPPSAQFLVRYESSQLERIRAQLQEQGYTIVRDYPSFSTLVVSSSDQAATASTASAAAHSGALSSIGGVAVVEQGGMRHLFPQPAVDAPGAPAAGGEDGDVCLETDGKLGPDADTGRDQEGTPYGIKMVQADDPAMIEVSKQFKDKVLFCVIDTGLDRTNTEFPPTTSGCVPGFPDGDTTKSYRYCYTWYEDNSRHGTHTSGTIGALRNGLGVVGVSAEGAQIYHYNYFGPNMAASDDLEVAAWQECIAELDRRKASTGVQDMKLVISMSYGSTSSTEFSKSAITSLAAARTDVLWIAAAGNGGDDTPNYPAAYPEVVSIGAVDWRGHVADFSTYNDDVELSAPGVQTLSTIPNAMASSSGYYALPFSRDLLKVASPLPVLTADADFFNKPKVARVEGSPAGSITAQVVNCGLGKTTCTGARGKICLVQRGENTFCEKIQACARGGGAGVIIFNRDDLPSCERLSGVSVDICTTKPARGWPLAVTATRKQGAALRTALDAGEEVVATINVTDVQPQTDHGLDLLSGTSMATPTAAGVTGLVWSAHTQCSSHEIRAALRKTALRPTFAPGSVLRDEKYGFGVVQALAAHRYLEAYPCNGSALAVAVTHAVVAAAGAAEADAPSALPQVGSTVSVRVSVQDPAGLGVYAQRVVLAVRPGRDSLACERYTLQTGLDGTASTTCKVTAKGPISILARLLGVATSGPAGGAVTSFTASR